jgi:hypothetical protein
MDMLSCVGMPGVCSRSKTSKMIQSFLKWNKRACLGQFVGFSDEHSSLVANAWHLTTGYISPQFHVVVDNLHEGANLDPPNFNGNEGVQPTPYITQAPEGTH